MFKPLSVLMVATLVLTSCASVRDSRVNPFNWFGRSESQPVAQPGDTTAVNPLIPQRRRLNILGSGNEETPYTGTPIAQVSNLVIERRTGGAIIRATGIADRIGPFDVRLIPIEAETDATTLSYSLSAEKQAGPRNTDPDARTVDVAIWLTTQELEGIRTVRVVGRDNAQIARR